MDNFGFKNFQQLPPVVPYFSDHWNKELEMIKNDSCFTLILIELFLKLRKDPGLKTLILNGISQ